MTELDFRVNPPSHDDTAPPEWVIGVNVAAGLWQWSDASASHCVYIVVAPASGDPESPSIGLTVNSFRYFDAREPVALLDGEVIVGYNETDDFSGIISGTTYPDCFLERVAEHQGPTEELFAERYSDLDEGYGDASGESSEWACRAHSGPEPADRLDWEHTSDTPHPEVSCEVGDGILPGWWQWSEGSADDCIYVVVDSGDGLDQRRHQSRPRRDARSPILLSEGEIVLGYSDTEDEFSSYIAAISHPSCFLEHKAPEDESPA